MKKPAAIVTIGVFDGVHLGHQMLVRQVVDRAHALGLRSLAVTFDPHPEQVLFPDRKLSQLTSAPEREAILRGFGLDDVWTCPFTPELSKLEPEEFMRMVMDRQPVAELWVGADFALGRGRRGSLSVLSEIGVAYSWALHIVPPLRYEGQIVSSTAIRTLLAAGAVRGAGDLLGRTYGVPAEITSPSEACVNVERALPRAGIYDATITQSETARDVKITLLPTPGHLGFEAPGAFHPGPAHIDFLRRGD